MSDTDRASNKPIVARGRAIGSRSVTGRARYVSELRDFEGFRAGEILLAEDLAPEWPEGLGGAAALVINRMDGAHLDAAARRLGIPAVVGVIDAASPLWTGADLTVSCDGDVGTVYEDAAKHA